jgi:SPOR domain
MADDRTQRPYRASQPPVRSAPGQAPAAPAGNDPLAELARLIGQNDPFAEYGRENARRAAPQAAAQQTGAPEPQEAAYADERYAAAPAQHADYGASDAYPQHPDAYPQQAYGTAPPAAYPARGPLPGYPPEAGYAQEAEYPTNGHSGAEDHDFYDDVPPRRRMGILAIAAVFALAVIGTAGAFGYRALFGSSSSTTPPPVIKADATPTKIVPAAQSKDPKSGKLIYDRVTDRAQGEKLVSREERPIDMKDKPTGVVMPQGQNGAAPGSIQAALGSGVVATEPKKVHTIAIRPDGTAMADAAPAPAPAPVAAPESRAPASARAPVAEPPPHQAVARAEPPLRRAPASSNAPLSLSPNAPQTAQPVHTQRPAHSAAVAAPTQIAPAPAHAAPAHSGGYAVQVSSQRSEADAQAAFHSLQAKFPSQLGGKQPLIHRVDLGAKGIYFRAMVGPFASSGEANQLCASLKAAGGQCIVQRN